MNIISAKELSQQLKKMILIDLVNNDMYKDLNKFLKKMQLEGKNQLFDKIVDCLKIYFPMKYLIIIEEF